MWKLNISLCLNILCIQVSCLQGGGVFPPSQQWKVSYLTDHSLSNVVSLQWMRQIQRTMHLADISPARCYHAIALKGRELGSFIGVGYRLSEPIRRVDERIMYLKWPIMVGEAKRSDENPILPHNHQRRFWNFCLTQCDVVTRPKWLSVEQWLLLRCFVLIFKEHESKIGEMLNVKLENNMLYKTRILYPSIIIKPESSRPQKK